MPLGLILKLLPLFMKLLGGLGITKDPEAEMQYKVKVLEFLQKEAETKSDEFKAFLSVTSDSADKWIRRAIVGSIWASLFIRPLQSTLLDGLRGFFSAGAPGLLPVMILLWEFYGTRSLDVLKWLLTRKNGGNNSGNNSGISSNNSENDTPSVVVSSSAVPINPSRGDDHARDG